MKAWVRRRNWFCSTTLLKSAVGSTVKPLSAPAGETVTASALAREAASGTELFRRSASVAVFSASISAVSAGSMPFRVAAASTARRSGSTTASNLASASARRSAIWIAGPRL